MRRPNVPSSRHWATSCSTHLWLATVVAVSMLLAVPASAQKPRARDLGVPFEGTAGPLNAITDVAGVEVGHTTLIRGSGTRVIGEGPVRTGVTAVFPRGTDAPDPVFAAWFSLNGRRRDDGHHVGPGLGDPRRAGDDHQHPERRDRPPRRDSVGVRKRFGGEGGPGRWLASLPVVAETWDGTLNDIYGQHVTADDALAAIENASGGRVEEGAVGGGTGMICNRFKGGIGTSSRLVEIGGGTYTLGVLVQCNYGGRASFRVAGAPVGLEIPTFCPPGPELRRAPSRKAPTEPTAKARSSSWWPPTPRSCPTRSSGWRGGSPLGLARNGSTSGNRSGDIFIAFSTANRDSASELESPTTWRC